MCDSPSPTNELNEDADIETALQAFFIRRQAELQQVGAAKTMPSVPKPAAVNYQKYIPLLLNDLQQVRLVTTKPNIFEVFAERVHFRNVIVYAEIVGRCREANNFYNYQIDDMTAVMQLNVYRYKREQAATLPIMDEIQALQQANAQNKKELANCLWRLMQQAKAQLDYSNLKIGTKLLIYGAPTIYRDEVRLDAWRVFVDDKISRNLEIAYKSFLLNWYANKTKEAY